MNIAQFARYCIMEGAFSGRDLDGGDVQENAARLGLIKQVAFDPLSGHIDATGAAQPGDPFFMLSDEFKAALDANPEPTEQARLANIETSFDIGETVIMDNDDDLRGFVTGFTFRGLAIEYEVSWIHNGCAQSGWFPQWRLRSVNPSPLTT